ncbi:hypothetical protein [Aeromonas salmonicida]|uniref:hypothetical protein n=1 Tax=Aeromonas salmonicida TaxID=645 RepID=UPI00232F1E8D|nr:hypothetical protein [Aeromonas salmonicida]WCH25228.1 hypothetical protein ONZ54_22910 [Aeromonas salmonicida]
MTNRTTFTRRQVRTLIQMAEVFQAVAREYPGTEFPWGSVAWQPEWFMDDALPVLERTATLNGIDAGSAWFTALAGTFAADIARWVQQHRALPGWAELSELARNALAPADEQEG